MRRIDNTIIHTFDVDDTIAMWGGITWTPNMAIIEEIKKAKARNHYVIVWSAGGVEWAESVVKELCLQEYVDLVMTKPSWYWDDKPADAWMDRCYRDNKN